MDKALEAIFILNLEHRRPSTRVRRKKGAEAPFSIDSAQLLKQRVCPLL